MGELESNRLLSHPCLVRAACSWLGILPSRPAFAEIVIEVDEFNTFHVTADIREQEAPSEHDLIRALRQLRDLKVPLNRLLVKANPDALHEKVVAALDSGAYVGIPEISLLTLE